MRGRNDDRSCLPGRRPDSAHKRRASRKVLVEYLPGEMHVLFGCFNRHSSAERFLATRKIVECGPTASKLFAHPVWPALPPCAEAFSRSLGDARHLDAEIGFFSAPCLGPAVAISSSCALCHCCRRPHSGSTYTGSRRATPSSCRSRWSAASSAENSSRDRRQRFEKASSSSTVTSLR